MAYINGKRVSLNGFISLEGVGTDTNDATATPTEILEGATAYVRGEKITGVIPKQVGKRVTPTTSDQTAVSNNTYCAGAVIVEGDSNLSPENIAAGVSIFGVTGTHEGETHTVLDDVEIDLYLTNGDQQMYLTDGYVVRSAVIKKPATLLPENIAEGVEIAGVVGTHSGGAADCATVTFMNGSAELLSRPVYIGDDCPDPVTQGRIDTPTKESTVDTVYTYSGWATADGGTASDSALQNITEDKTVYAAYTSAVRYYTVTFYDGDTVVHTEQVAYGGTSSYTYDKSGYMFNGWTPEPTNITGDTSCYGEWLVSGLQADSWETIAARAADGTAATEYSLGDTKDITVTYSDGTTEVVTMEIVGFNHDDLADGSGKAGISFISRGVLTNPRRYASGTQEGWENKELRTWYNGTLFSALPDDLASHIKEVGKLCTTKAGTTSTETVTDKIWLPSFTELGVTLPVTKKISSSQSYLYRVSVTLGEKYKHSISLIKYDNTGTARGWWVRDDMTSSDHASFPATDSVACAVFSSGEATTNITASNVGYYYCVFGFCI